MTKPTGARIKTSTMISSPPPGRFMNRAIARGMGSDAPMRTANGHSFRYGARTKRASVACSTWSTTARNRQLAAVYKRHGGRCIEPDGGRCLAVNPVLDAPDDWSSSRIVRVTEHRHLTHRSVAPANMALDVVVVPVLGRDGAGRQIQGLLGVDETRTATSTATAPR